MPPSGLPRVGDWKSGLPRKRLASGSAPTHGGQGAETLSSSPIHFTITLRPGSAPVQAGGCNVHPCNGPTSTSQPCALRCLLFLCLAETLPDLALGQHTSLTPWVPR